MDANPALPIHNSAGLPFVRAALYWCRNNNFKHLWETQINDGILCRAEQTRGELEDHLWWMAEDAQDINGAHLAEEDLRVLVAILDCVDFVDPVPI
jgi:hypothetical protein